MGLSVPSSIRCASTVPTPYTDVSQAKVNGRLASKCTRSLDDVSNSLDSWNAFSSLVDRCHRVSCLSNWYSGASTVDTSGKNLQ